MRARQRHLNPSGAGATLVLDARFISGLNDGDAVSTWTDRSGAGNNATQANASFQPLFKTNIQAGNPAVLFDGSNDTLSHTLTIGNTDSTLIVVGKTASAQTGFRASLSTIANSSPTYNALYSSAIGANGKWAMAGAASGVQINSGVDSNAGFAVVETIRQSTDCWMFIGGVSVGTRSGATFYGGDTAGRRIVGGLANNTEAGNLYACSAIAVPLRWSDPLRRRIEQSLSRIWKIACS